jgi:hypothetical protein
MAEKSERAMSRPVMEEIMRRASKEPHFDELLRKCPAAVLGGYLLTRAEKGALMSGDRGQLEALGIAADRARSWTALDGLD